MCGRFSGEVPGVELLEGGVDVVEFERDASREPIVGVDLDDGEHLGAERLGPLVAPQEAVTTQDEALSTGCDDGGRHALYPDIGDRPLVGDDGIPAVSDTRAHHRTAILRGRVIGQHLRHRVPVAGREERLEPLARSACCVLQSRHRSASKW